VSNPTGSFDCEVQPNRRNMSRTDDAKQEDAILSLNQVMNELINLSRAVDLLRSVYIAKIPSN